MSKHADLIRLLDTAVQKTVFNDNVGVNLSGGLDSSTVARLAFRWRDIPSFCGWYDTVGYDEREYARIAASGSRHHRGVLIMPGHFVKYFDAMLANFKPPWQGPGMFGQYMVAKYIAENTQIKTVLSGEGSDELFGGYARTLMAAGMPTPDGYDDYLPPADYPTSLPEALEYDYVRLPDLLAIDNGTLGAFGLTGVAPFTDQAVVDFALGLHPLDRVGKRFLREAVRGLVPDPIIDRTDKKGFPVPLVAWANEQGNPVRDFVGDRLGYTPDPSKPFDRGWWNDLCDMGHAGKRRMIGGLGLPTTSSGSVTYTRVSGDFS